MSLSSGQATFGFYNPNSLKALWWVSSSVDKTPVRLPDCPGKDELKWHKYQHINASHQIRLIELLPPERYPARNNSLERIRCKFHCTNLDQNPEYEALSYTWGSISRSKVISVLLGEDEEEALFATPQLVMALTRLRLPSKSRFLWIDQLCIDQKNEDEKGPQIQLMGQIYQKAQRVVIWLGEARNDRPEYDRTLSDSELLSNLCNEFAQSDNNTPAEDVELARRLVAFRFVAMNWDKTIEVVRLLAIYEVLNRPWFRRAWVFQEASLARELIVQYGSFEVRFEEFKRVMDAVYSLGSSFGISERRGLAFDTCGFEMMNLIQEARQGFLETHLEDSGMSKGIGFLPTLLRVLRRVDAFNPRDFIFAFLAFQNDEGIRSTKESYQQSPEDVWLQAAEQIIKTSGSLDIFAALSGDTPRQLQLPSWVPYWSDCFPYSRPIAAPGSRFSASGGLPHIWKKQDPQKLVVQGKIVDSIKAFPGPIPDPFVALSFGPTPAWNIIWILLEYYPRCFLSRHSDTLGDELPVKLQTLNSDLVRTLLCDGAMGSQQPLRCVPQMTRAIAAIPAAKSLQQLRDAGQNMDFTEEQSELLENYEKLVDLALVAEKKRMFWTENLQLGMACEDVKIGDQIAIIHGSKVPCLLRAVGAGSGEYRVISQCYLDGWMYGKPPVDRPHPHGTWLEEEQDEFVLV
jgi:Heterokaryon incompatibility protein (HET)